MNVIALPKLSGVRGEIRREPNHTLRYAALQLLREMIENRREGYPVKPRDIARQMSIVSGLSRPVL